VDLKTKGGNREPPLKVDVDTLFYLQGYNGVTRFAVCLIFSVDNGTSLGQKRQQNYNVFSDIGCFICN